MNHIITTDKVSVLDFNEQLGIQNNTYEGIKKTILEDEELAKQLTDPNLTPEQKETILNKITHNVMIELGYKEGTKVAVISTDEIGQQDKQIKGHYNQGDEKTGEGQGVYINDQNIDTTEEAMETLGHELAHAQDDANRNFKAGDADQNTYANNYGSDLTKYTNFASTNYGQGGLATSNNRNGNQTSSLIQKNNNTFAHLDKSKGDDLPILIPLIAAGLSAGANLYSQYKKNGDSLTLDNVDKSQLGVATVLGGAGGLASGVRSAIVVGGAVGATNETYRQYDSGKKFDFKEIGASGAWGAGAGLLGGAGQQAGKNLIRYKPIINKPLDYKPIQTYEPHLYGIGTGLSVGTERLINDSVE